MTKVSKARQMRLSTVESNWVAPEEWPRLWEAPWLVIDLETKDERLTERGPGWAFNDGFIAGVAVAAPDWCGYYPVRHEGGGNLPPKQVFPWLRRVLDSPCPKVFHSATYDLGWLAQEGIPVRGPIRCTLAGAALLDENRFAYGLDALGADWLMDRKNVRVLHEAARSHGLDPARHLWRLPARYVGEYAEGDVLLTKTLYMYEEERLREQNLLGLYSLECELLPILVQMRMRGIRVNVAQAEALFQELSLEQRRISGEMRAAYGIQINVWANESVAHAFRKEGVPFPRTEKGNPSFTAKWLERQEHPLAKQIVKARRASTLAGLLRGQILECARNGRVHCELHSHRSDEGGAVTGRFTSSNPNLQQVPSRDEVWGPRFRSLFLPEEGEMFLPADFDQQEFRLIVHYATKLGLAGASEAANAYRKEGADFHQIVADIIHWPRKRTKNMNFGMAYTMGIDTLADKMGVSPKEAGAYQAEYHELLPFMKLLSNMCANRAAAKGEVRTILGRKCRFPFYEPHRTKKSDGIKALPHDQAEKKWGRNNIRRAYTYKAMNRVIQGSGADMIKKAMRDCALEGILPLLQVHDELPFSVPDERTGARAKEIMANAVPLLIPTPVGGKCQKSWGG